MAPSFSHRHAAYAAALACGGIVGARHSVPPSVGVCSAVCLVYLAAILWQNRRKAGEPPVVWSWILFVGSAIAFGKGPLAWLKRQAGELRSDTFVAIIAGKRTVFLTNPDDWPKVLREPPSRLEFKAVAMEVTENAFGVCKADLTSAFAPASHKQAQRGFIQGLQRPDHLGDLTRAAADGLITSLADVPPRAALFETLAPPLFESTMRALTGDGVFATGACYRDFRLFDRSFAFLAGGAPLALFPTSAAALRRIVDRFSSDPLYAADDGSVSYLMRSRRALFLECAASAERAWQPSSHGRVQSTMVWAAAANTIPAALWTAYWLARCEEARSRVAREIERKLATEPDVPAALADEGAFPALDAAISEALRLSTASLTIRRVVVDDFELPTASPLKLRLRDRVALHPPPHPRPHPPPSALRPPLSPSQVALYPPLLHFDEGRVGARPMEFEAERYLRRPETPLMPFGGGISLCPGRKFARREIKAFVIHLLSRYDISLDDPAARVPEPDKTRVGLGIVGPAPGQDVSATFTPRSSG